MAEKGKQNPGESPDVSNKRCSDETKLNILPIFGPVLGKLEDRE